MVVKWGINNTFQKSSIKWQDRLSKTNRLYFTIKLGIHIGKKTVVLSSSYLNFMRIIQVHR